MYISGMLDGSKILAATSLTAGVAAGALTGSAIAAETDGNLAATGSAVVAGGGTAIFAAQKFADASFKTANFIGIPGAIGLGAGLAISGVVGGVMGLSD